MDYSAVMVIAVPAAHSRGVNAEFAANNVYKSGIFLDVLMSSEMATFLSFLTTKEKQQILNIEYISGIKNSCGIVLLYIVYFVIAHIISSWAERLPPLRAPGCAWSGSRERGQNTKKIINTHI